MSRLVIASDDGTVRSVDPVSRHVVVLGGGDDDVRRHASPVLSADGGSVAWSVIGGEGVLDAAVRVDAVGGGAAVEHDVVFPAFYLHWRPDGRVIAVLGSGPLGLECSLLDVVDGTSTIVERGAPLFLDWSPAGDLALHVGGPDDGRVAVVPAGATEAHVLPVAPGRFTAPQWLPDGRRLLVAGEDALLVVGRDGDVLRRVVATHGPVRFGADPWGERVAVVGTAGHDGTVLVDLHDGRVQGLTAQPPIAMWWSPVGGRLLVLVAGMVGGAPWIRHLVFVGGEVVHEGAWHRPSATTAREILPFPEQYARSHSPWSPDGDAYAYEGIAFDGAAGVWVQRLDEPEPVFVGAGQVVWWS